LENYRHSGSAPSKNYCQEITDNIDRTNKEQFLSCIYWKTTVEKITAGNLPQLVVLSGPRHH
jgi:hypothetical protein